MFERTLTVTSSALLCFMLSACEEQNSDVVSAATCEAPVASNFNSTLSTRLGEDICAEGFVGLQADDFVLAVPGSTSMATPERTLAVRNHAFGQADLGTPVLIQGIVESMPECLESDPPEAWHCHFSETTLVLNVSNLAIQQRPSGCIEISIETLIDDPLVFSYQRICTRSVGQVEGNVLTLSSEIGNREIRFVLADEDVDELQDNWGRVGISGIVIPDEGCVGPEAFCIGTIPAFRLNDVVMSHEL